MFTPNNDSATIKIKGPLFPTDLSPVLALFVGRINSPAATQTSTQPDKLSESVGVLADVCCEKTASESNQDQKDKDSEVTEVARGQRVIFQLNYLPKQILEEEVLEKLVKFGKIHHFSLLQSSPVEQSKVCEKRVGNFRSAEFSFGTSEAEQVFLTVKRIRIRGLQVKIGQKDIQKESDKKSANSPIIKGEEPLQKQDSALSAEDLIHLELPTSKKYFSGRSSDVFVETNKQPQGQYYFRRRTSPIA